MRCCVAALLLAGFAFTLSGCVYYPPDGTHYSEWCHYHPRRCPPPPPPPPPPPGYYQNSPPPAPPGTE